MSYQRDREDFIARMTQEGLPLHVTRLLLREATGLNRRAELACSSEAADRDRVPCPAASVQDAPCLCDNYGSIGPNKHERVPRIAVQDWRAEERIRKALETCEVTKLSACNTLPDAKPGELYTWRFLTAGDPRGYVLRVIPPSYAERNQGRDRHNLDSIGVPNGPSGLRW